MKALSVHKLEKLDVIGRNIMTGNMIGFVIWAMVGVIIISLGIRAYLSGKVAGFWANIKSIVFARSILFCIICCYLKIKMLK